MTRTSATPAVRGVTMLGRNAACAAVLFVWPVCTQISDGDGGPLLLPEIVVATGPQLTGAAQRNDAEAEKQPPPPETAALAPRRVDQATRRTFDLPIAQQIALQQDASLQPSAALPNPADAVPPVSIDPALARKNEPFGLKAEAVAAGEIVDKWSGVEAQIRAESVVLARCGEGASACPSAAQRFLAIIVEGRIQTGLARIGVINRAMNLAIGPMTDLEQWGEIDRWSPPLETFATGRGDCEDYAIAKYVALRAAGVAGEDVKIVIVRNTAAEENHAVVAVRVDEAWMIRDNRWLAMIPDRAIWRAEPLLVLDETGVRRFVAPADAAVAQTQGSALPSF